MTFNRSLKSIARVAFRKLNISERHVEADAAGLLCTTMMWRNQNNTITKTTSFSPSFCDVGDDSFTKQLEKFETSLNAMEVPKDYFEEDVEREEQDIKLAIQDDVCSSTLLGLGFRVQLKMTWIKMQHPIGTAPSFEAKQDDDQSVGDRKNDDRFTSEPAAFESTLTRMEYDDCWPWKIYRRQSSAFCSAFGDKKTHRFNYSGIPTDR